MSCPYLKTTYTAMNREIVAMHSCAMGLGTGRELPAYCRECPENPDNQEERQ